MLCILISSLWFSRESITNDKKHHASSTVRSAKEASSYRIKGIMCQCHTLQKNIKGWMSSWCVMRVTPLLWNKLSENKYICCISLWKTTETTSHKSIAQKCSNTCRSFPRTYRVRCIKYSYIFINIVTRLERWLYWSSFEVCTEVTCDVQWKEYLKFIQNSLHSMNLNIVTIFNVYFKTYCILIN